MVLAFAKMYQDVCHKQLKSMVSVWAEVEPLSAVYIELWLGYYNARNQTNLKFNLR